MSPENSSRLKIYVNNSVLDRKVLVEFVFKCGSLFWAFVCCFWFPVKLLERKKNNSKDGVKDSEFYLSQDNKTDEPMISPAWDSSDVLSADKHSPPEFSFSLLRREFGNSGGNYVTEVKLPTTTLTAISNRYQFISGKDVCGFMEEPETRGFAVEEILLHSTDNSEIIGPNNDDFIEEFHLREESCDEEDNYKKNFSVVEEEEMSDENDRNFVEFVPRKDILSFSTLDLNLHQFQDYYYLASFHESELCTHPGMIQTNSTIDDDDDDDYIEMELDSNIDANIQGFEGGKLSQPMVKEEEQEETEKVGVENKTWESDTNSDNAEEEKEGDEFDILLEHQNLVKQMKREVKSSSKVLKGGLPTISEEGEECAILKDLKPLKLEDRKFEYKDHMQEIRKFYKSYADKMRKLDILNYQSLQAISFVQPKECDKIFMQSKKASIPFVKQLFPLQKLLLFKERRVRVYADPSLKSINDLHRDLEVVYVGQVCLSWEILRWQYGKLIQLQHEHDDSQTQGPRHQYSYNHVASEFQQFQVLLQRFVEDERFRAPRIHNYVESRRFCHALLHVPMIKDDGREKKLDKLKEVDDSISVAKLVEIVKQSMEAFCEFVQSDKDENHTVVSKGCLPHLQVLHDDDPELVINIKASLEKKERKLKLIHKAGNCIVLKMFQKILDQQSCEMIMSQVELKLVSRVLSISRLSPDQLRWCERKLNCINIVNRRISMDKHHFSLFPC